ncbi:MAG TPA: DNA repair protein RecO [Actinomycetota bacterium]|nr:DNA repair protein RecO [Actinomycetota bacterium]
MAPIGQGIGLYRAQGMVVRATKLGEADRIVTFYTQSHGKIRGVAKGIRKAKSRFGGRLDAFTHVDLQLYRGRSDLDIVTQADIIERPKRIRADYGAFCAASAIADAVDRTTPERERNVRVFLLLRSAIHALEEGAADPALLAYGFLAKLTSIAGLHPTLPVCVDCGAPHRVAFSHARGGAVCASCLERADPKASDVVLDTWSALLTDEWSQLRERRLPASTQREVGNLLLSFVQWHTESRFRAFNLLPSLAAVTE